MKKPAIIMNSKLIVAISCFFAALFLSSPVLTSQPFKLIGVSDLKRVFEDGYKLPPALDTVKIFGIRGEVISGQCALNAKNNLTDVTVEVSPLKNQLTGDIFQGKDIEWNFVGSIPLTKNAPNQPLTAVVRPAPARFPDYLMAEKQVNVNKGMWQAIWK